MFTRRLLLQVLMPSSQEAAPSHVQLLQAVHQLLLWWNLAEGHKAVRAIRARRHLEDIIPVVAQVSTLTIDSFVKILNC